MGAGRGRTAEYRARGRSRVESDLDLAVDLSVPREAALARWLAEAAYDGDDPAAPMLQVVPLFAGDLPRRLDRMLAREGVELLTRS